MPVITKELALRIVEKLQATVEKRPQKPHDQACVYEDGKLIAIFGIRRGSKKNLGHDHIPRDLFIRPHQARLLAQCPLSRSQWIEILRAKGLI